jgi:2-keto-4-pentenoate hydratase/2-oxohepta-3-ene-1,7-dioic acid hydratase in catechol pathway
MTQWIRFEHDGKSQFGSLEGETITVHEGDMFASPKATPQTVGLGEVKLLTPTEPSKIVALWNNFRALGAKLNLSTPEDPLYFIKSITSALPGDATIRRPASYDGKVIFEGELGIVIGKACRAIAESEADSYIFGYTCINDVTAVELLNKDASFAQWTRAKSFDTFGVFGPVVATGLDPDALSIRTVLNGDLRQDYPVNDMIFPPRRLVSLISQDLTLLPGDVIACGTSVGVGSMKPGSDISVTIEGVGTLSNRFE